MKFFPLFSLLFCFSVCNANATATDQKESDVNAVAQRVEQLRAAMVSADAAILTDLTAKELSYGHSGGHVEGQAEFVNKITTRKSNFISVEFVDQTISLVGDAAIVRHTLKAHTRDDGLDKDIAIGVMLVWQKQHKVWKLIARQAFKLPTETH